MTETAIPRGQRVRQGRSATATTLDVARRYGTAGLIVILGIAFTIASPYFLTANNLGSLISAQGVLFCLAFAALFPLIIGEFDLSLGLLVGFLAVVGAELAKLGFNLVELVIIMIAIGAFVGLINGFLVVVLRISAFIATLATGIILGALSNGISNGQIIFGSVPPALIFIGRGRFLGVGISIWCVLVIAVLLVYLLEHTPLGRRLYAIGGSETVAFMAGVPTRQLRILAFVMAGVMVGIGAVFQLGLRAGGDPTFGPALLLPAYAAVFLGVTTHRPGQYNVIGTVIAIILLAVGFNGLSLIGIPFWAEPLFDGVVLLVAVLAANAEARQMKVGS